VNIVADGEDTPTAGGYRARSRALRVAGEYPRIACHQVSWRIAVRGRVSPAAGIDARAVP
jgi:hypothetical protein